MHRESRITDYEIFYYHSLKQHNVSVNNFTELPGKADASNFFILVCSEVTVKEASLF